jgi:hypothetical protein
MFKQRSLLPLVALLAAAVIAGCGSGGDSSASSVPTTVTTSSLGKAAFVKRANAICTQGTEKVEATAAKASSSKGQSSEASAEAFGLAFLSMVDRATAEIRELGAPQGDEEEVEAILGAMQEAAGSAKEKSDTSIEGLARRFRGSDKLASSYGIDGCVF